MLSILFSYNSFDFDIRIILTSSKLELAPFSVSPKTLYKIGVIFIPDISDKIHQ